MNIPYKVKSRKQNLDELPDKELKELYESVRCAVDEAGCFSASDVLLLMLCEDELARREA